MYSVEFNYLWNEFIKTATKEEQIDVIIKAVKNYLRTTVTKQCVFFDAANSSCKCHQRRPFACRCYGIIHPAVWKKRQKAFKQQHADTPKADKKDMFRILDQCDLVRTIDGYKHLRRSDEDLWFEKMKQAELAFGVPQETIDAHDHPNGSYRAMHDHIMLYNFDANFLSTLSQYRLAGVQEEDIEKFAETLRTKLVGQ